MPLRSLPTSLLALLLALNSARAFAPGELVRMTRGEMLQFQGANLVSGSKGQEFPVLQQDMAHGVVFVPFVKADGTMIAVTVAPDALEAVPRDGWLDLQAGVEAFRAGQGDAARQFIAHAAQDEKYKDLAAALAPRLQAALSTKSAASLQMLRDTASQLELVGYQSLALAIDEGTDKLGGPSAPPTKVNREELKKKVSISNRAVARARQGVAMRCLFNADQEIRVGLDAEPARPELKALQTKVQKDLEEANQKCADADRMRKLPKGAPHALTALEMGLKVCIDLPALLALKKDMSAAFEEKTAPPVTAAFLTAAGGGDPKALAEGHSLYTNRCTECHDLELLDSRTVSSWQKAVAGMARRAGVNSDQQQRIIDYIAAAQKVVEKSPGE